MAEPRHELERLVERLLLALSLAIGAIVSVLVWPRGYVDALVAGGLVALLIFACLSAYYGGNEEVEQLRRPWRR